MKSKKRIKKALRPFWERVVSLPHLLLYPKDSNNQILKRGIKRVYHYHIRKTGGTSLNFSFISLLGDTNILFPRLASNFSHQIIGKKEEKIVGWNKYLIEKGDYLYAFSHLPMHQLKLKDNTFTITILRDPIDRIISHYRMLVYLHQRQIKRPSIAHEIKWASSGFDKFLLRVSKKELLRQLYTFSKECNLDEALENLSLSSSILFTKRLNKAFSLLSKKIGVKLPSFYCRKAKLKDFQITSKQKQKLKNILEKEILFYRKAKKVYLK